MKHLFIDMDGTIVQLAGFDGKINVSNYDEPISLITGSQ